MTDDPLVGRTRVRAELRRALDGAGTRGRVLLLVGEPGIGKTALAEWAAADARAHGATVAWGWGWPGEGAPGYWPWVQVLRALGRPLPGPDAYHATSPLPGAGASDATSPAAARFQFFDEVCGALFAAAAERPLVVVLDDLQWADEASVLLLGFLARRLAAHPLVVVGTYRDTEPAPALDAALADLAPRSTLLPLGALSADEVGALMAGVLGAPPDPAVALDVHRRTGGNPFFVDQVTRLWAAQPDAPPVVPPGVREAVRRQLARLPADCAVLLDGAAVAGPEFSAELVARVAGRPVALVASLLEGARRARVLVAAEGAYRFAHDLLRETVLDALDPAVRAELHLAVGSALEAGPGEVPVARLADHFQLAGEPGRERALRYRTAAVADATRALAYEDAARHAESAWRLADGLEPLRRTAILLDLADARRRAGRVATAVDAYRHAARLARGPATGPGPDPGGGAAGPAGDPVAFAHAALGLHAIGSRSGYPAAELVAVLEEAAKGAVPAPLRARVLGALARVYAWTGTDLARADALAGEAVALARTTGDHATLATCLLAAHNARWTPGSARDRLVLAGEIVALAESAGDPELLVEARLLRAADLLDLADPGYRAELTRFVALAQDSRQPRLRYLAASRRATQALVAGDLAGAERLIADAAALGRQIGEPDVETVRADQSWELADARGTLGETAEAIAAGLPDEGSIQARGYRVFGLLARGARDEAQAAALPLAALRPGDFPRNYGWLLNIAYGAQAVAALGARDACADLYDALLPYATEAVQSGVAVVFKGAVAHYLGLLAAALGRTDEARAHFTHALAVHERLGAYPWILRTRYHLATLEPDEPEELADLAESAGRLGMAGLADAARAASLGAAPGGVADGTGLFRRDGTGWALSYAGRSVTVKDAKGLADIAALLRLPGRPVAAADLVAAGAGEAARAGLMLGADAVLDDRARRAYRARLADLDRDVAQAQEWHDPERAARARAERDALVAALAEATGLGGRARRLGDGSERARKAVTARIRDAVARIDRVHPGLAAHLRASISTGTACVYAPSTPVSWQL